MPFMPGNPGKSKFGEERYFKIAERIYTELDEKLANSKFLSGDNYTIADIATFPWIARHEWHDIGILPNGLIFLKSELSCSPLSRSILVILYS